MPRITDPDAAHAAALLVARKRELVRALREDEPRRSAEYAHRARLLADLYSVEPGRPGHVILEVAGLFKVGQERAHTMLKHGSRLVELYPRVLELLEEGVVAVGTAELLLWVTANAPEQVQLQLGTRIASELVDLDAADARRLITASMLEIEAELDPEGQKARHQQAQANRGVWVKPVADGMARIGAEVDEIAAQRFALDLQELIRAAKVHDDRVGVTRSAGQRGADVLAELPSRYLFLVRLFQQGKTLADILPMCTLSERPPDSTLDDVPLGDLVPSPRPSVEDDPVELAAALLAVPVRNPVTMYVHTAMTTSLDLDQRAGFLEGYGPISAFRCRNLLPTGSLVRLLVDARSGVPLGLDPDPPEPPIGEPLWDDDAAVADVAERVRRRLLTMIGPAVLREDAEPGRSPSAALARFLRARDLGCIGPGCPRHARSCELDHNLEVSRGGLTASWNLDCKSTRCHHARHEGWEVQRFENGTVAWLSPAGQYFLRTGPWRPPHHPAEGTVLPKPTLDRPDGGRSRSDWYAEPAPDLDSRFTGCEEERRRPPRASDSGDGIGRGWGDAPI